jgi:hypothetical protein
MRIFNTILSSLAFIAVTVFAALGLTGSGLHEGLVLVALFGIIAVAGAALAFTLSLISNPHRSSASGFLVTR